MFYLVLANTFKYIDFSSSTEDITKTKSKQKLHGLQVKGTKSHYHCLKNKIPKTISPPYPQGILLSGCTSTLTSSEKKKYVEIYISDEDI